MPGSSQHFTLFRPDIIECLAEGEMLSNGNRITPETWFLSCLAREYEQIAAGHDCNVKISATHAKDARDLWVRDRKRIEVAEDSTPDHFKQAGFLTYWLRRRLAVETTHRYQIHAFIEDQDSFVLGVNDICAFLFGFRLCLYFEFRELIAAGADISAELRKIVVEDHLKHDIATLMRGKNLSPHALYLIFRTLFVDLRRPRRKSAILRFV